MTITRNAKVKHRSRGASAAAAAAAAAAAVAAAALAGCQAPAPIEDTAGDEDISAALAALPEARVLLAENGVPQFIVGELGKIDPAHAATDAAPDDRALRGALPPILRALRVSADDLVLRTVHTDEDGGRHYRYDQRLHGRPVIGGDLVVHVDAKGAISGINGTPLAGPAPAPRALRIAESAAHLAIAGDARWAALAGRRISGARPVYVRSDDGAFHEALEHIVEGLRGELPVRDKVFVEAASGAIVAAHPTIHDALDRRIYAGGALVLSEGQPPTGDLDVDGAYDNLGTVYNAYYHYWTRDSYDGAGAPLVAVVHYGTNYCNAFWNGTQMVFGDGSPSQGCGPLARSLDVTAHELAHAVTQYESNLTYSGEPGGLNESYSDMFGAFVEAFGDGGGTGPLAINAQTFLIGDEVLPPFLRNMCDPAADGASRDIWTSTLGQADVHYSSGPNNLAFCLLAKGGTHPRGKTTNNVPAIGLEQAAHIFYRANTTLLTSSSNYAAMRAAAITAAQQLGYPQATQDAVACAYAAIGVGAAPASCSGTTPPPDGILSNGIPVNGLASPTLGAFKYWALSVPAGSTSLTFQISGGTGDADLYVHFGEKPTEALFQCRPYLAGNSESCTFVLPAPGTYWVGLYTFTPYTGVTLTGTYHNSGDPYLQNGLPVTGISGAANSARYWRIAVPAGRNLSVKISGGSGDADLYTRFGARPTTSTYACRPYITGNAETCLHDASLTAGDWYIMLRGYAAYSGVSLVASYY